MRVISGKFRGRKLHGPVGLDVRPTSDRLKETLFDILGPWVQDRIFLDVFAGTGAIGIEAISRGAREAVFIEQSREGCSLIRRNLSMCGITTAYTLIQQEAFAALRRLARQGFVADVIFMDPPYRWQPYADLLEVVFLMSPAVKGTKVIVEHQRKSDLPESGPGYLRSRIVRQGDHSLSFYSASSEEAAKLP
jgi:16S rRNA (guanine(966)-N(2))-methyltransferase RsmD